MFTVCALYHFTRFDDPAALRDPLLDLCRTQKITGTLLLAHEGINGTVAGPAAGIEAVLSAPCPAAPIWNGNSPPRPSAPLPA